MPTSSDMSDRGYLLSTLDSKRVSLNIVTAHHFGPGFWPFFVALLYLCIITECRQASLDSGYRTQCHHNSLSIQHEDNQGRQRRGELAMASVTIFVGGAFVHRVLRANRFLFFFKGEGKKKTSGDFRAIVPECLVLVYNYVWVLKIRQPGPHLRCCLYTAHGGPGEGLHWGQLIIIIHRLLSIGFQYTK